MVCCHVADTILVDGEEKTEKEVDEDVQDIVIVGYKLTKTNDLDVVGL